MNLKHLLHFISVGKWCILLTNSLFFIVSREAECVPVMKDFGMAQHAADDKITIKSIRGIHKSNTILAEANDKFSMDKLSEKGSFSGKQARANEVGLGRPSAKILVSIAKRYDHVLEPWEINQNICPPSLCTSSDETLINGTNGFMFYNGDIVLDEQSKKIIFGNSLRQRKRSKRATMKSSRTWKRNVVPYVFADNIEPRAKKIINVAMKTIENNTCIKFSHKKAQDLDYIRFISEPGCWANVGRVGGGQKVSIGNGCETIGTSIHEISHALGFWHEQARPDRDKYVQILKGNISPRYLNDFEPADKALVTSRGFPYDYESIMHYSTKAFTNEGNDTIKVIGIGKKLNMQIGQRYGLSNIDIAQLRDMYKCNDKEDATVTECPKGWAKKGRSCYKFEDKMREQFSGALSHCEKQNSQLLIIDDEHENLYITRIIKTKYPNITTWRTAGRLINGTFIWYAESKSIQQQTMHLTKWRSGHPGNHSSMALVYNKKDGVMWEGVWLGSHNQLPQYAFAFICEKHSKRHCVTGKNTDGRDYRGTLDHTVNGITCQKWSSMYPWAHTLLQYPYFRNGSNADGLGDHNYCRNPSGNRKSRPWCYTTKRNFKWQYCDVTVCPVSQGVSKQGSNGNKLYKGVFKTNTRRAKTIERNDKNQLRKESIKNHKSSAQIYKETAE